MTLYVQKPWRNSRFNNNWRPRPQSRFKSTVTVPWRSMGFLVAALAVSFVGYELWSPGLEIKDGRYDLGKNAIWLQHGWLGSDDWFKRNGKEHLIPRFRSQTRIRELADLLRNHNIIDVFPHLCPTNADGSLPRVNDEQVDRFFKEFEGFRVMPWVGGVVGVHAFPEDQNWRRTFVRSILFLLKQHPEFQGVHVNIEPCPSGSSGLLRLLEQIRKALPEEMLLSVATFPPPTMLNPFGEVHWKKQYYRKVSARADQVVVMMYNTSFRREKLYRHVMTNWTREVLYWSGKTQILLGIPSYEDKGVGYHNPRVENLRNAIMGLNAGLASYTQTPANYGGVAIYCEWEMNKSKWKQFRDCFLRNRSR
jgi:hypothetical protein